MADKFDRTSIYDAIEKERNYQVNKWGNKADVEINRPMDWVGYIANHSTRWFNGGFAPYTNEELDNFRTSMLKVATLAVAAIEATDVIQRGDVARPDVLKG